MLFETDIQNILHTFLTDCLYKIIYFLANLYYILFLLLLKGLLKIMILWVVMLCNLDTALCEGGISCLCLEA
jgi:hypothetical protein